MARLSILCSFFACIFYFSTRCDGFRTPMCKELCTGPECDVEPEGCLYNTTKDFCGRTVCRKGPGMRCGGISDVFGKCGSGMLCQCGRCTGCSLNKLGSLDCNFSKVLCFETEQYK